MTKRYTIEFMLPTKPPTTKKIVINGTKKAWQTANKLWSAGDLLKLLMFDDQGRYIAMENKGEKS